MFLAGLVAVYYLWKERHEVREHPTTDKRN
jgi:hypothetical protein